MGREIFDDEAGKQRLMEIIGGEVQSGKLSLQQDVSPAHVVYVVLRAIYLRGGQHQIRKLIDDTYPTGTQERNRTRSNLRKVFTGGNRKIDFAKYADALPQLLDNPEFQEMYSTYFLQS